MLLRRRRKGGVRNDNEKNLMRIKANRESSSAKRPSPRETEEKNTTNSRWTFDALERVGRELGRSRQVRDDVRQDVVEIVALAGQLGEEQLGQVRDAGVLEGLGLGLGG